MDSNDSEWEEAALNKLLGPTAPALDLDGEPKFYNWEKIHCFCGFDKLILLEKGLSAF